MFLSLISFEQTLSTPRALLLGLSSVTLSPSCLLRYSLLSRIRFPLGFHRPLSFQMSSLRRWNGDRWGEGRSWARKLTEGQWCRTGDIQEEVAGPGMEKAGGCDRPSSSVHHGIKWDQGLWAWGLLRTEIRNIPTLPHVLKHVVSLFWSMSFC